MCGGKGGDFGCPKCAELILNRRHGWVECKSTSFPGNVYYFHTVTGCSTWRRPVPRNTQLPRYKKWQDLRSSASPATSDQIISTELGVSGNENSGFKSTDVVPPSDFELHARRMQIYLQKNTDYSLQTEKYGGGESLRDALVKYYKRAKFELAKKLNKKIVTKKSAAVNKVAASVQRQKKIRRVEPMKIIRECHGIKTISYDPVVFELSNGVKMPDLSETETSIDSFTALIAKNQRSTTLDEKISKFEEKFAFNEPNLSEPGTSISGTNL